MAISNTKIPYCRIAHLADNTSALAWLRKTSFHTNKQPIHNEAARLFATMMMEYEATLASVHKPGKHNIIADILSRDTHIAPDNLKFILKTLFPSQVPPSLDFVNLTDSIDSGISYLLRMSPNIKASPVQEIRSNTGILIDRADTCEILESKTHFGMELAQGIKTSSSVDLLRLSEEINMAQENLPCSELAQSFPPQHINDNQLDRNN